MSWPFDIKYEESKISIFQIKNDWLLPETHIKNLYQTGVDILSFGISGAISSGVLTSYSVLGYGTLFRVAKKWIIPLSFLSEGPRVPEDIRKATRSYLSQKITDMI